MSYFRKLAGQVCLLGLFAVFTPRAEALSVRPMTPEQVLANSDMVAVATVVGQSARWTTAEHTMIATDYRLRLDRVLSVPEHGIRREGAVLDRERFELVADALRRSYGWT